MEFDQVLAAYRKFDPAGWVAVYRVLPMWAGILCVALGVVLLLFGGGRAFRIVAGPIGALVGWVWVGSVPAHLGMTPPPWLSAVFAAALAAAGFAFPQSVVFFAFGIPAGLAAGEFAGPNDWLLGFIPGFLVVGAGATALYRWVGAVTSSLAGGWLVCIGLLAALHQIGTLVTAVASAPWGVLVAALLFAVAGSVYQLAVRPSPEQSDQVKLEKTRLKKKVAEKKALEERWANYSDRDRP